MTPTKHPTPGLSGAYVLERVDQLRRAVEADGGAAGVLAEVRELRAGWARHRTVRLLEALARWAEGEG